MPNRPTALLGVFCLGVLLIVAGCGKAGPERGTVRGEVQLNGQPLELGSILFTPVDGTAGAVAGGPIENGKYQLSGEAGVAIGTNRVEIRASRKTGKMVPKPLSPPGEMVEESVEIIPAKFNTQSTLKAQIKSGDNVADFQVESE